MWSISDVRVRRPVRKAELIQSWNWLKSKRKIIRNAYDIEVYSGRFVKRIVCEKNREKKLGILVDFAGISADLWP